MDQQLFGTACPAGSFEDVPTAASRSPLMADIRGLAVGRRCGFQIPTRRVLPLHRRVLRLVNRSGNRPSSEGEVCEFE